MAWSQQIREMKMPANWDSKSAEYWDAQAAKARTRARKADDIMVLRRANERAMVCEQAAYRLRQKG